MNVCKHPNNIESIEKDCDGNKKYNICYGEGNKYSNLKELEEHVNNLEKDSELNEDLTNVYTTGCWENKTNQNFLKDFNKNDVKDPIKCLIDGNKWITGDGYIIKKDNNSSDLKNETASKINVECSPGYEGEPGIEVDQCENYKEFKEGDDGEYQQFTLLGCNKCPLKYGGNRENKDDRTCYPVCGLMGTTIFNPSNSNKKLRFIDTKKEFKVGEKRAGYCCNDVANSLSIEGIKGSEKKMEGSNYLECRINKCKDGYIKNDTGNFCCRKIENSKDDIKYSCNNNSENTEPLDKEVNFCKDGFYPFLNEDGKYSCKRCEIGDSIHPDANTTCDINGENIKINSDSEYKCVSDGLTYYNDNDNECVKCPHNMKINDNYESEIQGSNICICKDDYLIGESCFQCLGENIEYNEEYPENNDSKCKCVIEDKLPLSDNVLIGDCENKTLYNGETCNLTCKDGYKLMGSQPRCLNNHFDKGTVTCINDNNKEDKPSKKNSDEKEEQPEINDEPLEEDEGETTGENAEDNEDTGGIVEGFSNIFDYIQINTNTKRLFLLFLLIILILYLC